MGQKGLVKIAQRDETFRFKVEGTGALAPEEIVLSALKRLKEKLQSLDQMLKVEAADDITTFSEAAPDLTELLDQNGGVGLFE